MKYYDYISHNHECHIYVLEYCDGLNLLDYYNNCKDIITEDDALYIVY